MPNKMYRKKQKDVEVTIEKNRVDIISNLIQRPFLRNLTKKIFSFLDIKSLENCRKVSGKWKSAINELSIDKLREIDWIDDSFMPMCLPLSNPRGQTASWVPLSTFGKGYLNHIDIHLDGRIAVSSGRQIWIFCPKGVLKNYIILKAGDAFYIKIVGKFLVAFDNISNISIFEIFLSESLPTIFRHTVKSNEINLLEFFPTIPKENQIKTATGRNSITEIPRGSFYYKNTFYFHTTRQIVAWEIDENLRINFSSIYLHKEKDTFVPRVFLHAIFVDENGILLSVGGVVTNRDNDGYDGMYISKKTSFIRALSLKGEIIKDIGKNTVAKSTWSQGIIRQICRRGDLVISLAFDDVVKCWDLNTGKCIRTLYEQNTSCASKIHLTDKLMIWSVWGKLNFFDLDKLERNRQKWMGIEDFKLRSVRFHHEIVDFAYDHHRILLCSKKLHIICNKEHYGSTVSSQKIQNPKSQNRRRRKNKSSLQ